MAEGDTSNRDGTKPVANESDGDDLTTQRETDQENLHDPSRWWFASTACPLLAGTFGPIANGFSICALVYSWRLRIPEGGSEAVGIKISDPHWLIAVNVLSLVSALIGNASLLLNMAHRMRFSIAQPITITGFSLAGVLLVVDMSVLTSSPSYFLTLPSEAPSESHALSSAFYYAIFASSIYFIIAMLLCLTVWGASREYYAKDFCLTASQRTLMLQTMLFVGYLLLGALVFCKIENWEYLDAVYWADVTLLTVGLGDMSPSTHAGRCLLFPFAIGGILIVGLVIGSIRSLVLERGEEKLSARITEKRRSNATENIDPHRQTIKISNFAWADFNIDPSLTPVQRREEEFRVMRKVQKAAENERRYYGLVVSAVFALSLWLLGAVVFMIAERGQGWTYFQAVYFTYVSLLTIGYGGDTIIKWFSDFTESLGGLTVLPSEHGFKASAKASARHLVARTPDSLLRFIAPGILGDLPRNEKSNFPRSQHDHFLEKKLSDRLRQHLEDDEVGSMSAGYLTEQKLESEWSTNPSKEYSWQEWEYFLKLMGNEEDTLQNAESLVPEVVRIKSGLDSSFPNTLSQEGHNNAVKTEEPQEPFPKRIISNKLRRKTISLKNWSWLSSDSPLMSSQGESEWLLERLSLVLERELNQQRRGIARRPPIGWSDIHFDADTSTTNNAQGPENGSVHV